MRRVIDTDQVAHYWANQVQSDARNPQSNFSFVGPTLYSYSTAIAHLRANAVGQTAAILSSRSYSNTTNRHQSDARQACGQFPRFYANDCTASPERIRDDMVARIGRESEAVPQHRQARMRAKRYAALLESVADANRFCTFFGLAPIDTPPPYEDLAEHLAAEAKKRARAEKLAKAKAIKSAERDLALWKTGLDYDDAGHCLRRTYSDILGCDSMRIENDEMVTTQYARVPLDHVRRVAGLVLRLIQSGSTYQSNGHSIRLGHYTLDSIDESGTLRVGCHTFKRNEIERIAALLGATADATELESATTS